MRAIGYCRVSHEEQAKTGISLEAQKAKIKSYCQLKDLELTQIIEDAGISAKDLNRPGMQRLLKMAKGRQIDAVVVYKLDRMFRSTMDALETTKRLDKQGVAFHSIQETLDTKSAVGKFFFTILASIAELERGLISERTKLALQHKKRNGEKVGGWTPFGYDVDRGRLQENPREQEVISDIKEMRAKGMSLPAIARHLNESNIPTKQGKCWFPQQVSNIVKGSGLSYVV